VPTRSDLTCYRLAITSIPPGQREAPASAIALRCIGRRSSGDQKNEPCKQAPRGSNDGRGAPLDAGFLRQSSGHSDDGSDASTPFIPHPAA